MCDLKMNNAENIPITKGTGTQKAVICSLNRSFCWFTYIWLCTTVGVKGGMRQESDLTGRKKAGT